MTSLNKEQLKNEIYKLSRYQVANGNPILKFLYPTVETVELDSVISILDNVEKPIIPQFVADWIEDLKSKKINLLENIYDFTHEEDINNYIRVQGNALMRAWLDGYEVEEEQKYYIPLGVTRPRTKEPVYLMKADKEGLDVDWSPERYIKSKTESHKYRFTEQEIKDYDDRFWPFAVKVEELEE